MRKIYYAPKALLPSTCSQRQGSNVFSWAHLLSITFPFLSARTERTRAERAWMDCELCASPQASMAASENAHTHADSSCTEGAAGLEFLAANWHRLGFRSRTYLNETGNLGGSSHSTSLEHTGTNIIGDILNFRSKSWLSVCIYKLPIVLKWN